MERTRHDGMQARTSCISSGSMSPAASEQRPGLTHSTGRFSGGGGGGDSGGGGLSDGGLDGGGDGDSGRGLGQGEGGGIGSGGIRV